MADRTLGKHTRREFLAQVGATALGTGLSVPAIAQSTPHITMTLPWLPQGSQFFSFIARNKGFWKKNGLDVEIVRGFGSGAAIQTVVQGKCQVGIIAAPSVFLAAAQGLQTKIFDIAGYDTTMGILTTADSPIKTLKDLEGRKLGSTLASAEVPFIDPFLTQSGVVPAKVTRVSLQANVLESSLLNKQVDAISAFATSNLPSLLSRGIKTRFFPYSSVGIKIYSNALITTPEYVAANNSAIVAWVEGMNEALRYCMLNFEDAVQIFVNEVPEVKMSQNAVEYTSYGAGLFISTMLTPELKEGGIGWGDKASVDKQIDLVMKYAAGADAKRPRTDAIFTNEMAGKIKLTQAEWDTAAKTALKYAEYLNFRS